MWYRRRSHVEIGTSIRFYLVLFDSTNSISDLIWFAHVNWFLIQFRTICRMCSDCWQQTYTIITTLCPPKMCHPLVTIISSNLNRFSTFFHCCKSVKFPTKQCVTLPTTPKICCCTTWRKLNVQIWCIFLHIKLCSNKEGSYQTRGGNFITTWLIIKFSRTMLRVHLVSYWLRTRSLTRSVFS